MCQLLKYNSNNPKKMLSKHLEWTDHFLSLVHLAWNGVLLDITSFFYQHHKRRREAITINRLSPRRQQQRDDNDDQNQSYNNNSSSSACDMMFRQDDKIWQVLPDEMIEQVLSFMPPMDCLRMEGTCHQLKNLFKEKKLWKRMVVDVLNQNRPYIDYQYIIHYIENNNNNSRDDIVHYRRFAIYSGVFDFDFHYLVNYCLKLSTTQSTRSVGGGSNCWIGLDIDHNYNRWCYLVVTLKMLSTRRRRVIVMAEHLSETMIGKINELIASETTTGHNEQKEEEEETIVYLPSTGTDDLQRLCSLILCSYPDNDNNSDDHNNNNWTQVD